MKNLSEKREQEIIAEVLAARTNHEQFLVKMKQRQQEGLKVAKKCANFLREKYGVTKVVLFGSLLNYEKMTSHSDIDLAVWGLPEKDYFKAVGFLLEIAAGFSVDLVEIQNVRTYILPAINQGVEL
ncbi:MAG: nucleotidyltransferase family protein [Microcystaceae cyanobacterium]